MYVQGSVTRLCDFWKFLGTKILVKVAQIFSKNIGLLWKTAFFTLNWCGWFLGNFWRKLGYFLLQHLVTLVLGHFQLYEKLNVILITHETVVAENNNKRAVVKRIHPHAGTHLIAIAILVLVYF